MEAIFHEKVNIVIRFYVISRKKCFQQEGSLCAQHCLNSLLQGAYFTAVDLSTLAQIMDEAERQRMAENGVDSEEYRRFLEQPSGNMDDSGYFSVQVISSALEVWGLELVPYSSTDERVKEAIGNPCLMQAYICNFRDHWLTIRKIGNQWFNLNSLLSKPELISDTYLSLFLAQLKNDGYSIFVIIGKLPDCDADQLLRLNPVGRVSRPVLHTVESQTSDPELEEAIRMSLADDSQGLVTFNIEETDLQRALQMSMQNEEEDEDMLLKRAINMSLQC